MEHESTTDPLGNKVYRFIATLKNGKEVVTWAADMETAKAKLINKRGGYRSIRPAGSPLTDRPKPV